MSDVAWKSAAGSFFLYVFVTLLVCLTTAAQSASPPLASADAAMHAGRFADAAREHEAWLKAHPDAKVLLALGIYYVQLGRPNEAVATLLREGKFVLRNAGEDVELLRSAHTLLARAYLRLNQPEKAQRHRSWIEAH